jgi:indolepyruvate ferredoxin oxidoreductase alpha subunit
LAHSRSGVVRQEELAQNKLQLPENANQFVLLPAIARKNYKQLIEKQADLEKAGMESGFNQYIDGKDKSLGIIASGIAYNYLMENFKDETCPYPVLKISQYPLPVQWIARLVDSCEKILVLEEGMPIIEEQLRGLLNRDVKVMGRLDGSLNRAGELNPNLVAAALGKKDSLGLPIPELVAPRPPKLCDGCPHIDSYNALNETLKPYGAGRVFSDIGCYTLGFLPPFHAINACVDMGASITMAKGAADAGLVPAVAVIGDSTFTHSGITGLLDCVNDKAPVTIMILDNETTGMTGGQDSSALGKIEQICEGMGVEKEHIRVLKPLRRNHDEMVQAIAEELAYNGVSVIIPRRECIQTLNKRMREKFSNK